MLCYCCFFFLIITTIEYNAQISSVFNHLKSVSIVANDEDKYYSDNCIANIDEERFIVVYSAGNKVYGRFFSSENGKSIGDNNRISVDEGILQRRSVIDVKKVSDDYFGVVWQQYDDLTNVYLQIFDFDGNPIAPSPSLVNSNSQSRNGYPFLISFTHKYFIVLWKQYSKIAVQLYSTIDDEFTKLGSNFILDFSTKILFDEIFYASGISLLNDDNEFAIAFITKESYEGNDLSVTEEYNQFDIYLQFVSIANENIIKGERMKVDSFILSEEEFINERNVLSLALLDSNRFVLTYQKYDTISLFSSAWRINYVLIDMKGEIIKQKVIPGRFFYGRFLHHVTPMVSSFNSNFVIVFIAEYIAKNNLYTRSAVYNYNGKKISNTLSIRNVVNDDESLSDNMKDVYPNVLNLNDEKKNVFAIIWDCNDENYNDISRSGLIIRYFDNFILLCSVVIYYYLFYHLFPFVMFLIIKYFTNGTSNNVSEEVDYITTNIEENYSVLYFCFFVPCSDYFKLMSKNVISKIIFVISYINIVIIC